MSDKVENRRRFFQSAAMRISHWIPGLGLLGFRFHSYANPVGTGWAGWITWCGKLVGFLRLNRTILWWP